MSLLSCAICGLPMIYDDNQKGHCYDPKCNYTVEGSYDEKTGTQTITMTFETDIKFDQNHTKPYSENNL